jgi:hypothetical protein
MKTPTTFAALRAWITAGSLAAVLLGLCGPARAGDALQERFDEYSASVNRARGLALTVLKTVKHIDGNYRGVDGQPLPGKTAEAHTHLVKAMKLKKSFESTADQCDKQSDWLSAELSRLPSDDAKLSELKPKVSGMQADIDKYRKYVDRYYDKTVGDFGEPSPSAPTLANFTPGQQLSISGEATASLGRSAYERPNASPSVDVSATDIAFGVNARYAPRSNTNVLAHIDHKSTVQQREIGLTNFGASVLQNFSPKVSASAGLDYSKYSDKDNDLADFSDLGMFARFDFAGNGKKVDAKIKHVKRDFGNFPTTLFGDPNYSIMTLTSNAQVPFGQGALKMRLNYVEKRNDIEYLDHNELNPSITWQFTPGGSEAGINYYQYSHPNEDDSPKDNSRMKVHYYFVKSSGAKLVRFGPEVLMYKFPNVEDNEYNDFKFMYQSQSRKKGMNTKRWNIIYRMYSGERFKDFAQLEYRRENRPLGSGSYSKYNLAGRYYTESSDKNDPLRFGTAHPPHTADLYYGIGLVRAASNWIQQWSVGPMFGSKVYFDTERDDAFGSYVDSIDFVWQNPRNSARVGLELGAIGNANGVSIRAKAKYYMSFQYNTDPMYTTSIFEIDGRMTYPIGPKWHLEGYTRLHSTRAEANTNSYADLNKTDVGVQVRYLFDVQR